MILMQMQGQLPSWHFSLISPQALSFTSRSLQRKLHKLTHRSGATVSILHYFFSMMFSKLPVWEAHSWVSLFSNYVGPFLFCSRIWPLKQKASRHHISLYTLWVTRYRLENTVDFQYICKVIISFKIRFLKSPCNILIFVLSSKEVSCCVIMATIENCPVGSFPSMMIFNSGVYQGHW